MKMQVLVRLKSGVLDVQGKAVEQALTNMGYEEIKGVRIGKLIEMEVPDTDLDAANLKVEKMCKDLLVNPIIESYEIRRA